MLRQIAEGNVIVLSFDALRPDVLGVYGSDRGATPGIDRFATSNFVFEDAYTVAPVTPTSFAAAFSGMLPTRVFQGWSFRAERTLASALSQNGYLTAAFMNNVQLTSERNFDTGFDLYRWYRGASDEEVLQEVQEWISAHHQRKFFLWVHLLRPHAPYQHRKEAQHLYRSKYRGEFDATTGVTFEATDPEAVSRLFDLYLGEVWTADRLFTRFLATLRQYGLLENSFLLLTSDHGEEFEEHGGLQHGRLYEEHLRIPMILHHPGTAVVGRSQVRIRNIDLLPTLLYLTGHAVDWPLDGTNVFATGSRPGPTTPSPLIGISMTDGKALAASLLENPMKLIANCPSGTVPASLELYDLAKDPSEKTNLAPSEASETRRLLKTLGLILRGDPCTTLLAAAQGRLPTTGLDEESVAALRALGYLN